MEELVVVCHVEKLLKMGNFMLIRALFYPFMKKGQVRSAARVELK